MLMLRVISEGTRENKLPSRTWISLLSVVFCKVEVSARRDLVHRIHADCGVSFCVI